MGMDVYGKAHTRPEGKYFRVNIWGWGPICEFMEQAGFEVPESWHMNDGAGLATQAECDTLAEKLQVFLREQEFSKLSLLSDLQVDSTGRFLPKGQQGESPYSVRREKLEDWIRFLRACGGFEIC